MNKSLNDTQLMGAAPPVGGFSHLSQSRSGTGLPSMANTMLEFSKMKKREGGWMKPTKEDPHEARFSTNLDKLPTVSSKIKRGECTDAGTSS